MGEFVPSRNIARASPGVRASGRVTVVIVDPFGHKPAAHWIYCRPAAGMRHRWAHERHIQPCCDLHFFGAAGLFTITPQTLKDR
ncbi:hypothetical protein [Streptomyces sp. NPDC002845]